MKKLLFVIFLTLFLKSVSAYHIADSVVITVDRVVVYKKSWVSSYTMTVKSPAYTGTYAGPMNIASPQFVYCRGSSNFNGVCNLILSSGILVDTIPVVFAGNPGTWLRDLPKSLQPCYMAGVTLSHFGVEGTKDLALPGEQVVVALYTVGSLNGVFSGLRIADWAGNPVSNVVTTTTSSGGLGTHHTATFTLTDTLKRGREYFVTAYINCGALPAHPNIWFIISCDIYRAFAPCIYHTVVLIQQPPLDIGGQDTTKGGGQQGVMVDSLYDIIFYPNPSVVGEEINFSLGGVPLKKENYKISFYNSQGQESCGCSTGIHFILITDSTGRRRVVKIIKE